MGLLDKLFRGRDGAQRQPGDDDEPGDATEANTEMSARNAPRREVVQVVLRESMRMHGIPSDWIECKILSVSSTTRGPGMHVVLVIREGEDRLVTYVHAFQDAFMRELVMMEPRAVDWVFSVSWQFEGNHDAAATKMPDPASWGAGAKASAAEAAAPSEPEDETLQTDLQALYAALKQPGTDGDFEPTHPGSRDDDAAAAGGVRH